MIPVPKDLESRYTFVSLASERCTQLMHGARQRLESVHHKPTMVALEEVRADLVELQEERPAVEEPLPVPPGIHILPPPEAGD